MINSDVEVRKIKRFMVVISPLLIVAALLGILTTLKHVTELDAEEKLVIKRFQEEQHLGREAQVNQLFSSQDYQVISTSFDRLHEGANYLVFGRKWGYRVDNSAEEFKKIRDIMMKKTFPLKQKDFGEALKFDLDQAEKHYGKKVSHDILSDLSYYVFPKENQKKEHQYGTTKSLYVMNKIGIKAS